MHDALSLAVEAVASLGYSWLPDSLAAKMPVTYVRTVHAPNYGTMTVYIHHDRFLSILTTAREIGEGHGATAAAWWQQDALGGRQTDHRLALSIARRTLEGLDDCDPEVLDALPYPDLSGEWADGYSPRQLAADCQLDLGESKDDHDDMLDGLCSAYEQGFATACESAIVNYCRDALEEEAS